MIRCLPNIRTIFIVSVVGLIASCKTPADLEEVNIDIYSSAYTPGDSCWDETFYKQTRIIRDEFAWSQVFDYCDTLGAGSSGLDFNEVAIAGNEVFLNLGNKGYVEQRVIRDNEQKEFRYYLNMYIKDDDGTGSASYHTNYVVIYDVPTDYNVAVLYQVEEK